MPERKRPEKAPGAAEAQVSRGRLALLGVPVLQIQTRQLSPVERKTAGILAYLTLEGPTPRSRLAGLLWPESSEATARNNLAQALRRLKQATGAELVRGADVLELQGLEVDVAALEVAHFAGRHAEVVQSQGRLLEGHDYDDCPDFDDWLIIRRERLDDLRRDSLTALAEELEQAGQYREALSYAERLVELDPLSEAAHRRVMRLWYLSGDRPAALKAYDRCKAVLQRELGMAPLAETQALAAQIAQGSALAYSSRSPRSTMPLSLIRPPLLVGREKLWAAMEEAYQKGQVVFLRGEPGVGKTRLATDFAASKGRVVLLAARPGDVAVPYSSYARSLRESFSERPGLAQALPAWVRRELARILPELEQEAPPPLLSEADKLRFYDALSELTLLLHEGAAPSIQVSDDAQYLDPASLEAMLYQLNKYGGVGKKGQPPFTIEIYRRGEMSSAIEQEVFYPLVERGLAVLLDVEPLEPAEAEALVGSLEVAGLPALAPSLVRYAGGNPFFVLETARSLVESGALQKGVPQKLPASGKVRALIQRRLERLSPQALNLARTAAVASTDFSVVLAARVLQTSPVALSEPLAELQTAQVMQGHAFVHDLLYEATLEGIPASIKLYLHQQVAAILEEQKAEPARIAAHWLEGEPPRAIPFLIQAARKAEAAYQLAEAAQFYQRALELADPMGNAGQTFDLLEALSQVMSRFDTGLRHAALVERMLALADTPARRARAWLCEAIRLGEHAYGLEAEQAARQGLQQAEEAGLPDLRVRLLDALAQALFVQRKTPALIEALEQLRQLHLERGDALQAAICTSRLGIAYDQLERHREALGFYREAGPVLERSDNRLMQVGFHHNRAVCLAALGYAEAALEAQLQAQRLLEGVQGAVGREVHHLNNLALRYYDLERYAEAQQALERALQIVPEEWGWTRAFSQYQMARLHRFWGAWGLAADWLGRALAEPDLPRRDEATYRILEALLAHQRGEPVGPLLERLEALFAGYRGLAYGCYLLAKARMSSPEQALLCTQEALTLAQQNDWPSLEIAAHTLRANVLLELPARSSRDKKEAQRHIQAAVEKLETYWPTGCTRLEVLWVRYRAQTGHQADSAQLRQVLDYLRKIADQQVPPAHRPGFLHQNPLCKAILEAAQSAGIATF
ncbi:BTAD domain-containing putative transcriptional regulator [Meiothermus sp. CFH 77666]|uniref:ATP-binding protein n=1 Tax=Meiothermus sp. CFH 77666 TaxID=2817942 RepID=UPI001AA0AAEC|nr:BTAD domain-containing putative transcriptional regulator [Meiothermus sp. CFH 77666]MBO1437162.1 AAA family ATPase [Meiothermus sp. CFH 77666]